MYRNRKSITLLLVVSLLIAVPSVAMAHGVWFAYRLDQTQLVCGEGWKDNAYSPDMVLALDGYDADWNPVEVTVHEFDDHITIDRPDDLAVAVVEFDYGYWSNNTAGEWLPYPMDQVEGSTVGTWAVKYSVNYLNSVNEVKEIENIPYQFVPSVDPTTLEIGEPFTVQLLHNGEPMADTEIIPDVINHHTESILTDENGYAEVVACNGGVNVIGAEIVVPYDYDDGKATRSKVFTSLSFTLYPFETE